MCNIWIFSQVTIRNQLLHTIKGCTYNFCIFCSTSYLERPKIRISTYFWTRHSHRGSGIDRFIPIYCFRSFITSIPQAFMLPRRQPFYFFYCLDDKKVHYLSFGAHAACANWDAMAAHIGEIDLTKTISWLLIYYYCIFYLVYYIHSTVIIIHPLHHHM